MAPLADTVRYCSLKNESSTAADRILGGPMTTSEQASTVPVVTFDYTSTEPEGTWFAKYDELRSQFPWYRNDFGPGCWTVCNCQGILDIMQNPEVFSNSVVTALDPEPAIKWIPEM